MIEPDHSLDELNQFDASPPVIICVDDDDELLEMIPTIHSLWNNNEESLSDLDPSDSGDDD